MCRSEGVRDISEGIHDINEGIGDIEEGLIDIIFNNFREGERDIREGLKDIREGLEDIIEGLRDLDIGTSGEGAEEKSGTKGGWNPARSHGGSMAEFAGSGKRKRELRANGIGRPAVVIESASLSRGPRSLRAINCL